MRAAVVAGPNQLEVREVPMPQPGPYQALVRIEACSLCNSTDIKIIERHFVTHIPTPLILGHESVGVITALGEKVRNYTLGQRVLRPGAEYAPEVGIASAWGGLAEYGLATDLAAWAADHPGAKPNGMWAKQQVIPNAWNAAEATAFITLKETLFSARAAGIDRTAWTAIVGTGPVARAFTYWARWLGAPFVVLFGRRKELCHDFLDLGANNYVAGGQPCAQDESKYVGLGAFDRVIEAVGSVAAQEDALALARPDGLVGVYGVAAEGDAPSEPIRAARAAGRMVDLPVREEDVHAEALALVSDGTLQLSRWISHRLPLEDIHEGLRLLRERAAIKVVIEL